ncbi:MAG: ATP-dependent DNA helicase RecG, partial [Pseudomonadota bacterium]
MVDLLWHLPINVTDRRLKRSIADAQPGDVATLKVRVDGHIPSPNRRRPYTIRCMDETGMLHLVYFNVKAEYLQKQLPVGETRIVSGKIEIFNDQRQMAHPDFTVPEDELDQVTGFQPVYGLTTGVTPRVMKKAIDGALGKAPDLTGKNDEGEWIDAEFKRRQGFPSWKQALVAAHAPQGFSDTLPNTNARRRLAYDELLANQLALAIVRATRRKAAGRSFVATQVLWNQILGTLPFTPTSAQTMALAEIAADMREETRMLRLLQGDVGSGKTLVGLGAMTIALESG